MLDAKGVADRIRSSKPKLIAIDGLPVSGKSTLADHLAATLDAQVIYLDDFVHPEAQWRGKAEPAFPFPYIRYDEFLAAVHAVASGGTCAYHPYDWQHGAPGPDAKIIAPGRPVVVEGVSALHPDLAPLYDLRLWVESDASTTLPAALARGVGDWETEWRTLFMPSVEIYMRTDPASRADAIVRGRM